jgi:hypothetical protein
VVWPQNHLDGFRRFGLKIGGAVSGGLTSKPTVTVSDGLASKPVATVFFSLTSKPVVTVYSSLTSKLVATISPGLASKSVVGFLVEPQNQGGRGFLDFGLKTGNSGLVIWVSKITATVFWFGHQNQASFSLSVAPQNRRRKVDVRHALRSSGLFGVKASLSGVSQSGLKTSGGAMVGGARDIIVEVA